MRAGLLGTNIGFSFSPALHAVLWPQISRRFDRTDALEYELFDCETLEAFPELAKRNDLDGLNITRPFKREASRYCTTLTSTASEAQSVNCIAFGETIAGHSTDGIGLIHAMKKEWGERDLPPHWILYGAGGASRSVVHALMKHAKPAIIDVFVRNLATTDWLHAIASKEGIGVHIIESDCSVEAPMRSVSIDLPILHVQTTPLGQHGSAAFRLPEIGALDSVIDLVYSPFETPLVKYARVSGASAMGGLGMLIEQAALSQVFWLVREAAPSSVLSIEEYELTKLSLRQALKK